VNAGIDNKAAGQGMILSNIGENLTLLTNGMTGWQSSSSSIALA
jgi:hypothetical protein